MKTISIQALRTLTPAAALEHFKAGGKVHEGATHEAPYSARELAQRMIARTGDIEQAAHFGVRGYALSIDETVALIRVQINLGKTLKKPSDYELRAIVQAAESDKNDRHKKGYLLPSGHGTVTNVAALPGPPTEKDRLAAELRLIEIVKEIDALNTGTARGALLVLRNDEILKLIEIETKRGSQWFGTIMQMVPLENRSAHTFRAHEPNPSREFMPFSIPAKA
jgi:hypothetical protein